MNKRCMGCGVVLQTEDKNSLGYTPDIKNIYCMRCFRLKNYGERLDDTIINNDEIIKKINKRKGVVFFFIDYLNINRENIVNFEKIKLDKVLIISKSDVIRKEIKFNKIKSWLKDVYKIDKPVYFLSNKNNYSEINIFKYMKVNKYNEAYIMGITNAGKSTFINKLINNKNKEIVVSDKTNTTRDFIKLPINEVIVYDTPGFSYQNSEKIMKHKEIKPISYNLKENMGIVIDDKISFYFGNSNKIVLNVAPCKIKKVYDNIDGEYKIEVLDNSDIVIPGYGFINVKNKAIVYTNIKDLELRASISRENYE